MCTVCVNCGRCEGTHRMEGRSGRCPFCGFENEKGSLTCVSCGSIMPKPPGMPAKGKDARGTLGEKPSERR